MHDNRTVVCTFSWWEVLPHHRATCDATARRPASRDADAGAAAVAAALCACVQCSGHPLLVGESQCAVHFSLGGKGSRVLHHLWHFKSNIPSVTTQSGMDQTIIDPLGRGERGSYLIGWIRVRRRVSTWD